MLDASLFSALKRKYSSITKDNSLISKFTQKMMKIKKAYQTSVTEELIKSSWEATGFKLVYFFLFFFNYYKLVFNSFLIFNST